MLTTLIRPHAAPVSTDRPPRRPRAVVCCASEDPTPNAQPEVGGSSCWPALGRVPLSAVLRVAVHGRPDQGQRP